MKPGLDIRPVVIRDSSFISCAKALGYLIVRHVNGCCVVIETNRLQRRELVRNGISYHESTYKPWESVK